DGRIRPTAGPGHAIASIGTTAGSAGARSVESCDAAPSGRARSRFGRGGSEERCRAQGTRNSVTGTESVVALPVAELTSKRSQTYCAPGTITSGPIQTARLALVSRPMGLLAPGGTR